MTKKASLTLDELTPKRVASKLKKFSLGKSYKKSKNSDEKKDKDEDEKNVDGKLIVDEDDKKEELENATYWKTMNLAGGAPAWILIVLSFFVTSGFSKFRDF